MQLFGIDRVYVGRIAALCDEIFVFGMNYKESGNSFLIGAFVGQ